ncbi:MAG: ribulose-phosphate 3-epimerase, partial [Spiribacter salinus]
AVHAGADVVVAGSAVFGGEASVAENIARFRQAVPVEEA